MQAARAIIIMQTPSVVRPLTRCRLKDGTGVPALQDELLRQAVPEAPGERVRTPHVSRRPLADDA